MICFHGTRGEPRRPPCQAKLTRTFSTLREIVVPPLDFCGAILTVHVVARGLVPMQTPTAPVSSRGMAPAPPQAREQSPLGQRQMTRLHSLLGSPVQDLSQVQAALPCANVVWLCCASRSRGSHRCSGANIFFGAGVFSLTSQHCCTVKRFFFPGCVCFDTR